MGEVPYASGEKGVHGLWRRGEGPENAFFRDPLNCHYLQVIWHGQGEFFGPSPPIRKKILFRRNLNIMEFDKDGNLYFVDRTVDMIKHKGYRVSSSEVEAVLQEHPAVISSCVIGVADEKVGERIKAFVVLKEDIKGITGYDLIRWCRDKLVPYKIPQYIEFRDMLPKSKVGKLLRREIRTQEKSLAGE